MAKFLKLNVDGFPYAHAVHVNGPIADAVLGTIFCFNLQCHLGDMMFIMQHLKRLLMQLL